MWAATQRHLHSYASAGLRTLCLAARPLSEELFAGWHARYLAALDEVPRNDAALEQLAGELERDMTILGATAVEDRLQVRCRPSTPPPPPPPPICRRVGNTNTFALIRLGSDPQFRRYAPGYSRRFHLYTALADPPTAPHLLRASKCGC